MAHMPCSPHATVEQRGKDGRARSQDDAVRRQLLVLHLQPHVWGLHDPQKRRALLMETERTLYLRRGATFQAARCG